MGSGFLGQDFERYLQQLGRICCESKRTIIDQFFLTHQLDGYFSTLYIHEYTYIYIYIFKYNRFLWMDNFSLTIEKEADNRRSTAMWRVQDLFKHQLDEPRISQRCQAKPWENQIFPEWIIQFPGRILYASCIYIPESMSNSCWMDFPNHKMW